MTPPAVARQCSLWVPVVVYAGAIFFLSSRPALDTGIEVPHLDKLAHLVEYAGFGYLCARAFQGVPFPSVAARFRFWAVVLAVAYGLSDESHLVFVPTRTASMADCFFDALGAAAGQAFRK